MTTKEITVQLVNICRKVTFKKRKKIYLQMML